MMLTTHDIHPLRSGLNVNACNGLRFLPGSTVEWGLNRHKEDRHHQQRQGDDGRHPAHHARAQGLLAFLVGECVSGSVVLPGQSEGFDQALAAS